MLKHLIKNKKKQIEMKICNMIIYPHNFKMM